MLEGDLRIGGRGHEVIYADNGGAICGEGGRAAAHGPTMAPDNARLRCPRGRSISQQFPPGTMPAEIDKILFVTTAIVGGTKELNKIGTNLAL